MTILACWIQDQMVRCLADARLTFIKDHPGIGADVGSKIASIPITVWCADANGGYSPSESHSLGFAFAGSALIGATTFLRGSSITQMLRSAGGPALPSVADVANLFGRIATANTVDVRSVLPKADPSEMLVFGHCPIDQRPRVFRLSPDLKDSRFTTAVTEVFPTRVDPLVLGSGRTLFLQIAQELFNAGIPRSVDEIFARTLRDVRAREHAIGGVPSSITSTSTGTSVGMVLHWDREADEISEYVLGLAIRDAGAKVGDLDIAFQGAEPDHFYRLGERILQREKVHEGDLVARESLRDLAVIHYFTELALKIPDRPDIRVQPACFYVEAYKPAGGEHCYCVRCSGCPAEVPMFRDMSNGAVRNPLIGATLVRSCWNCGTPLRVQSMTVFPRTWPRQIGLAIFVR